MTPDLPQTIMFWIVAFCLAGAALVALSPLFIGVAGIVMGLF